MADCRYCGKELSDEEIYCSHCENEVPKEEKDNSKE